MAVLAVLCWTLNKYCAYQANEVILCVEVRALEVEHGLKALLPYGVLLILNWEKHDRQCCCTGEAVLAQRGAGDV
jgi:hypothetical protein